MSLDSIVIAIEKRRKKEGLSKADIADIAGMSTRTYERIESGEADMHFSQYRAILRALKCSDLDISLDMLCIDDVTDYDVLAATRLLSSASRKLLVKLLFSIKEQEI